MERLVGATTLTSPVDGCTLTISRRARGLSLMATGTGLPAMRSSARDAACDREDELERTPLRMDFSLPAEPASLVGEHPRGCFAFAHKHDNSVMNRPRFHLAFPVRDLAEARAFYGQLLGCREGRSSGEWVDFDFFGHQIVAHLTASFGGAEGSNRVDGEDVPVRHFGVILGMPEWRDLAGRLKAAGVEFLIKPGVRFEGQAGEQATLFIRDPSGNALEFKAFTDDAIDRKS